MDRPLIEQYYRWFNERRLQDAAALFTDSAEVELVPGRPGRAGDAYVQFAEAWIAGFPDIVFSIEAVEARTETICEVHLRATGTHRGVFDFGPYRFKPGGAHATLRLRELLDIQRGRITASVLTVDVSTLISQLTSVNYDELTKRVNRLCALRDALAGAANDPERRREVAEQIGIELDGARRALRPHFGR